MTVLVLPSEVVALVGKACDSKTRNACRLAHSHFRNVHEDVDVHQITISTTEGCKERLETALRLKPRLKDFKVFVKGVKEEGEVDLSPLQPLERVEINVEGCCSGNHGLRLTGVSGKHVFITLEASAPAVMSPDMLAFLMQQAQVNIQLCEAQCAAVLSDAALLAKVHTLMVNTHTADADPQDAVIDFSLAGACANVVLGVRHKWVQVVGADAITELYFENAWRLNVEHVRSWFNETTLGASARLRWVMCANVPWEEQQLADDTLISHLVALVHTRVPAARICIDALHPYALQFVEERVPREANLSLLCVRVIGGAPHQHETYVAARLAHLLLKTKGRDVPIHHRWHYDPPAELKSLSSIQELYDGFESPVHKQWWHWLTFLPMCSA